MCVILPRPMYTSTRKASLFVRGYNQELREAKDPIVSRNSVPIFIQESVPSRRRKDGLQAAVTQGHHDILLGHLELVSLIPIQWKATLHSL